MAIIVTHVAQPPEQITYDPKTAEVTVVRQYEARGAYPINIFALERSEVATGPWANAIPGSISVSVYKDGNVTPPPWGLQTVRCIISNMSGAAHAAVSTVADASTVFSVTYTGYTVGVVRHDLDMRTESGLQKVDIDPDHVDDQGRPRSIGAKGEGVNRQVPKGEWRIVEIFANSLEASWKNKQQAVSRLTTSLCENGWRPQIFSLGADGSNSQQDWGRGTWLYLGATITPLIGPYYQAEHTFVLDPLYRAGEVLANPHSVVWREETQIEVEAELGEGETEKRLKISYGPEKASQIYPFAGEKNDLADRDMETYYFRDLGF